MTNSFDYGFVCLANHHLCMGLGLSASAGDGVSGRVLRPRAALCREGCVIGKRDLTVRGLSHGEAHRLVLVVLSSHIERGVMIMEEPQTRFRPSAEAVDRSLGHWGTNLANASTFDLNKRISGYEITPVQFAILHRCFIGEADTVTDLAQIIPIGGPSMSRQVDQLVTKGLLQRQRLSSDRRIVRLTLTEDGLDLVPKLEQIRAEIEEELTEGISEDDMEVFISVARRIVENFEKQQRS